VFAANREEIGPAGISNPDPSGKPDVRIRECLLAHMKDRSRIVEDVLVAFGLLDEDLGGLLDVVLVADAEADREPERVDYQASTSRPSSYCRKFK